MADVSIRPATAQDGRFVADSWLRSFQGAWHVKKVPPEVYWRRHRNVIAGLIEGSRTIIACDPLDPWTIWGWACGRRDGGTMSLHYVYVKDPFRGLGIGTRLFEALSDKEDLDNLVWSHDTRVSSYFLEGLRHAGLVGEETVCLYNPYLAYDQ